MNENITVDATHLSKRMASLWVQYLLVLNSLGCESNKVVVLNEPNMSSSYCKPIKKSVGTSELNTVHTRL